MAGRYLVTGVQLGMIRGLLPTPPETKAHKEIINLINEVVRKQFIGDSEHSVEEDAETIINLDWEI